MIDIGSQVVCIDDDWFVGLPSKKREELKEELKNGQTPVKGQIYTVRAIIPCGFNCGNPDCLWLLLEEIVYKTFDGNEVQWWIGCFRPVKKTDISQFTSLLRPAPTPGVKKRELEKV